MRQGAASRTRLAAPAMALGLALLPVPARAADLPDAAAAVRQTVLDIISFTRWPRMPTTLRLCVVGPATHAAAFLSEPMQAGDLPVQAKRMPVNAPDLGETCDALYAGPLSAPERSAVQRAVLGRPILTMGEAAPGCIEQFMFCLDTRGPRTVFSTNLDAIAHGTVRLNPRVLLLGRRGAGQP